METKSFMIGASGRKVGFPIVSLLVLALVGGGLIIGPMGRPLSATAAPAAFTAIFPAVVNAVQQTVSCNSDDMKRHWCNVYTGGRVRLIKQKSDSPCVQGRTWGYTNDGIWVDRGCRADFEVGRGGGGGGGGRTISCDSNDMKRHWCSVSTQGGVRLIKQKSDSPCIQGRTWGYNRNGIWVDRGCRAEFEVGRY